MGQPSGAPCGALLFTSLPLRLWIRCFHGSDYVKNGGFQVGAEHDFCHYLVRGMCHSQAGVPSAGPMVVSVRCFFTHFCILLVFPCVIVALSSRVWRLNAGWGEGDDTQYKSHTEVESERKKRMAKEVADDRDRLSWAEGEEKRGKKMPLNWSWVEHDGTIAEEPSQLAHFLQLVDLAATNWHSCLSLFSHLLPPLLSFFPLLWIKIGTKTRSGEGECACRVKNGRGKSESTQPVNGNTGREDKWRDKKRRIE